MSFLQLPKKPLKNAVSEPYFQSVVATQKLHPSKTKNIDTLYGSGILAIYFIERKTILANFLELFW